MTTALTLERFAALLDAYGATPTRWPAAERAAALALRDANAEALRLWQQAQALDAALDGLPAPQPVTAAAAHRVIAALPPPPRLTLRALWQDLFASRLTAPAFALALVAGIATGLWLQPASTTSQSAPDLWQLSQIEGSTWTQLADRP